VTLLPEQLFTRLEDLEAGPGYRVVEVETDLDPLAVVRAGSHLFGMAVFLSTPSGERMGGLGSAWRGSTAGSERFTEISYAIADIGLPVGATVFTGFSFADSGPLEESWAGFAAVDAVLPVVTMVANGSVSTVRVTVAPGGDPAALSNVLRSLRSPAHPPPPDLGDHIIESHPHVADWRAEVAEAVAAIRAGHLQKVVLARSVLVRSAMAPDGFDLVHHLDHAYPGCFSFGWAAGGSVFVGSSPELLLSVSGREVRTNPLAGSAARGEGELEDRALGDSLMASRKDRVEHALVVDDVAARLQAHATDLTVPDVPSLRKVATVQHLSTDIRGVLLEGSGLFGVLADLHPTPAVGGTPRADATAFIDKIEGIDRGWYAGGIGWVRPSGDGTVALALRCGLIRGSTAHLYAGAGIVADSDPDRELSETRLKLRPLLELLAAG